MNKLVYLDNNATTRVAPEVFEEMKPFLSDLYGNPSSIHTFAGGVRKYIDKAREQVAALLGSEPEEIIFTGGGSESDNTAIMGALELAGPDKRHVIITRVEHEAVLEVGDYLLSRLRPFTDRYPMVGDVRGSGLFIGIELVKDRHSLAPAGGEAAFIAERMREAVILLGTDGPFHNVVKIRPPMPFSIADADLLVDTMAMILDQDFS